MDERKGGSEGRRDAPRPQGEGGDLARGDPEEIEEFSGRSGGGQTGGGAYPNPHTGKDSGGKDGFMGTGGQTEMPYHGTGSLGRDDTGPNPNSPAEHTRPGGEDEEDGA